MSESRTPRPGIVRRILRWVWRGLLALVTLVLVAMLVGFIVQSILAARDARRFPPPGALVDVGGRELHLDCQGSGEPTVVIEAGLQDWSTGWQRPQAAIARHTRVCSYDRAGLGWSDPSDEPKDALHMTADLHALLAAAELPRPVVLVGHSLGGMLNRVYYDRYPEEVAGMVVFEPGDPNQVAEMFPEAGGEAAFGSWVDTLAAAAARVGAVRFVFRDLFAGKGYPEAEVAETRALMARPPAVRALASSVRHLPVTAAQTRAVDDLGSVPLAVVYSSRFDEVGTHFESDEERQEFKAAMVASWERVAGLSTRGRDLIVIDGADHASMIRDDRHWPQAVAAILEVVEEVRTERKSEPTTEGES